MYLLRLLKWLKYATLLNQYAWIHCVALAIICAMFPVSQAAPAAQEYQIKAVFLFNFVSFVTWPANAFKQDSDPFACASWGDDPFGAVLDLTVENHEVEGRSLKILRLKEVSATRNCQILFISNSEQARQEDILRTIRTLPVLTVGDNDEFLQYGGMIKFFNRNKKIRLGINPDALEAVGLKANANLLNLSEITRVPRK